MTKAPHNAVAAGLVVDLELDLDELRQLPRRELEALRDMLPAQEPLPAPVRRLRRRLEHWLDASGGVTRLRL
ncbi:hypothetical protein [uncultured Thiohalocapsa sp.]|uniref:hypothetical protein n=1 Tax=uncultured Thiohalocapsa sp. TaxID=768990 RepID=UPI0025CFA215|nr:hypothetical protein [uncultured Thiohalocapsa sp.]